MRKESLIEKNKTAKKQFCRRRDNKILKDNFEISLQFVTNKPTVHSRIHTIVEK